MEIRLTHQIKSNQIKSDQIRSDQVINTMIKLYYFWDGNDTINDSSRYIRPSKDQNRSNRYLNFLKRATKCICCVEMTKKRKRKMKKYSNNKTMFS
mmetsp:Transcript_2913/g.6993  ORF Transcript_2913/g.6993 Transcript_2913/m.6993 type:complete len:96 (+) Transcript_2913:1408-1695(+)